MQKSVYVPDELMEKADKVNEIFKEIGGEGEEPWLNYSQIFQVALEKEILIHGSDISDTFYKKMTDDSQVLTEYFQNKGYDWAKNWLTLPHDVDMRLASEYLDKITACQDMKEFPQFLSDLHKAEWFHYFYIGLLANDDFTDEDRDQALYWWTRGFFKAVCQEIRHEPLFKVLGRNVEDD